MEDFSKHNQASEWWGEGFAHNSKCSFGVAPWYKFYSTTIRTTSREIRDWKSARSILFTKWVYWALHREPKNDIWPIYTCLLRGVVTKISGNKNPILPLKSYNFSQSHLHIQEDLWYSFWKSVVSISAQCSKKRRGLGPTCDLNKMKYQWHELFSHGFHQQTNWNIGRNKYIQFGHICNKSGKGCETVSVLQCHCWGCSYHFFVFVDGMNNIDLHCSIELMRSEDNKSDCTYEMKISVLSIQSVQVGKSP